VNTSSPNQSADSWPSRRPRFVELMAYVDEMCDAAELALIDPNQSTEAAEALLDQAKAAAYEAGALVRPGGAS